MMQISEPYYLIIDFEATCADDGSLPAAEMEIIEIGAVMQNAQTLELDGEFQTFIKPVRHPRLTPFCTQLTTITQSQVDNAPDFPEAFSEFHAWVQEFPRSLFCSWGNYDRNQLQQDCAQHDIEYPFTGHMNIKAEFSSAIGSRKRFGLGDALRQLGLTFEGQAHRGIDDARNIARIVRHVRTGA